MKQYPRKFRLRWNSIEWGRPEKTYYFYWFDRIEVPENRWVGIEKMYYDGWHKSIGFWWFCITWSTPWTKG